MTSSATFNVNRNYHLCISVTNATNGKSVKSVYSQDL